MVQKCFAHHKPLFSLLMTEYCLVALFLLCFICFNAVLELKLFYSFFKKNPHVQEYSIITQKVLGNGLRDSTALYTDQGTHPYSKNA